MSDVLGALEGRIRAGETITWEDGADIFENTIIGSAILSHNALGREQIVEMLKKRYGNEAALTASISVIVAMLDSRAKEMH